jgi:hypothetical protein
MTILSLLDKDLNLFKRIKALTDKNIGKMDHIKDIILMLREYVKVGEVEKKKFGEVMTPLELVKEMLATLPEEVWSNPNLKWLDPANGTGPYPIMVIYKLMNGLKDCPGLEDDEVRYKHIVENMIYVCELQPKNMFLYMCAIDPFDAYKLNIYTGSFLEEGFDYHMKNVWGLDKFDVVMANPPFNQMIDMLFIQKSYKISDKVLFVHPSTWLIDEKRKQNKFNDTKNLIKDHLSSIELFNGNGVFGISLFVPCVITYVDKNKKNDGIYCIDRINKVDLKYENINQINKYSNLEFYTSIKNKIIKLSKIDNLVNHKNKPEGEWYINVSQIRGDVKNRDKRGLGMDATMVADTFYTIVTKDIVPVKEKNKHMVFCFSQKNYAENFLNFLKTDFVRFCLSIYKNNSQLDRGELEIIPWLDFTKEWNDKNLYEYFSLTKEEVDFIEKNIPKYY